MPYEPAKGGLDAAACLWVHRAWWREWWRAVARWIMRAHARRSSAAVRPGSAFQVSGGRSSADARSPAEGAEVDRNRVVPAPVISPVSCGSIDSLLTVPVSLRPPRRARSRLGAPVIAARVGQTGPVIGPTSRVAMKTPTATLSGFSVYSIRAESICGRLCILIASSIHVQWPARCSMRPTRSCRPTM